jgi:hypothetical protein
MVEALCAHNGVGGVIDCWVNLLTNALVLIIFEEEVAIRKPVVLK